MSGKILIAAPAILLWIALALAALTIVEAFVVYSSAQSAISSGQLSETTPVALSILATAIVSRLSWACVPFGIAALLYRLDRRPLQ